MEKMTAFIDISCSISSTLPSISKSTALSRISTIDFSQINQKLMVEDPQAWTAATTQQAESLYRRFLMLHMMFPSEEFVPTKVIDAYWHQHILDTRKYAADCDAVFGTFLHHDPYFGINGEVDRQRNAHVFAQTQKVWSTVFEESLLGESNPCKSTDCR
jgi:hypothetical protein